jgi:hypothetical protein
MFMHVSRRGHGHDHALDARMNCLADLLVLDPYEEFLILI